MPQVKLRKRYWECVITLFESGQIQEELQLLDILKKENVTTISKAFVDHKIFQKVKIALFLLTQREQYVTVESVLQIKEMISKDKLNRLDPNFLMQLLYKISVLVLIGNVKVLSPLFKKSKMVTWNKWLSSTEIDYVDLLTNSLNKSSNYTPLRSWFSIKQKRNQIKNSAKTSSQLSMFSPVKRWVKDDIKNTKTIQSTQVEIRLTKTQKTTLDEFMDTYRYIYNQGTTIFNWTGCYKKEPLISHLVVQKVTGSPKEQKIPSWLFRSQSKIETNDYIIPWWFYNTGIPMGQSPDWTNNTPSTIRKKALAELESNVKSCFTNLKNGNIDHFKLRYKSKKALRDVIEEEFATSRIRKSNRSYFLDISKLKGLRLNPKTKKERWACENMKMDIKIMRSKLNRYYVIIPFKQTITDTHVVEKVCELDPGYRTFLSGIDVNGNHFTIGDNCYQKLKDLKIKYAIICSRLKKIKTASKEKKDFKEFLKLKRQKRFQTKCKYLNLNKIAHYVKELHNQAINYLVKHYDTIVLGKLEIKNIIKSTTSKAFHKMVLSINHYAFRCRLENKCKALNKTLQTVNESYTSQTCFNCSNRKLNLFSKKTYNCNNCNVVLDRDLNGAANILKFSLLGVLK